MYVKNITYTDFNGVERTEPFYFNLTKAEIAEMQLRHPGGYVEYIERIIAAKEQTELIDSFRTLILNSYGEKSEDGKYFTKSKELSDRFATSEAYSELFMSLMNDVDEASAFVNGIMPKVDMTEDQKKELSAKMESRIASMKAEA
jgi:hypothetical protein